MARAITRFYTLSAAVAAAATVFAVQAAGPGNFKPDGMVTGSALSGWHIVGDADWKAQDGELVGKVKAGGNGGWLVMDKSFQDVQLYANYRCTGQCTSGILLRAQKTADGGMNGVYVSLTDGDTASYFVTIDAKVKRLRANGWRRPRGVAAVAAATPGRGAAAPGTGGAAPAARGAEGVGGAAGPPAQPAPAPAAAAGQPLLRRLLPASRPARPAAVLPC